MVLFHHAALTVPALADVYFPSRDITGAAYWLGFSPLHLIWAGSEAVALFFVLSGVVLTLSTQRTGFSNRGYFPSRLVRLYLPVFAAVAFAAVTIFIVPRVGHLPSVWAAARPNEYSIARVLSDVTLVGGTSEVVSPLWSLTYEVLFSLLLPAYVIVAKRVNAWVVITGSLCLIELGSIAGNRILTYLPMFALGVALAQVWPQLTSWAASVNAHRSSWLVWLTMFVTSVMLTLSNWLRPPLGWQHQAEVRPLMVIGVTGFVILAAFAPAAKGPLSRRPVRWLGRISFSLYLIHEPLVLAFAYLNPHHPKLGMVVAIAVAIPVAWLFYICVERPSHRLAKLVAARAMAL